MSLPKLLEAVKDRLVTVYPTWIEGRLLEICSDGRPPIQLSGFKDFFVGITGTEWQPGDLNETNPGLHEVLGFQVVVSKKITFVPNAKLSDATWHATRGIYVIVRQVVLAINNSYEILTLLNTGLSGSPYLSSPKWQGSDPEPEEKGPDWLGVTGDANNAPDCLVVRSRFGGVDRIQCATSTIY